MNRRQRHIQKTSQSCKKIGKRVYNGVCGTMTMTRYQKRKKILAVFCTECPSKKGKRVTITKIKNNEKVDKIFHNIDKEKINDVISVKF